MLAGDRARVGYELRAAVRELSHTYTRCKEHMLKIYDKRISDGALAPAPTCPPPSPPCPKWPVCADQESPSDYVHDNNPRGDDDDKKDVG